MPFLWFLNKSQPHRLGVKSKGAEDEIYGPNAVEINSSGAYGPEEKKTMTAGCVCMCVEKNWPLENLWDTKTDELTMLMTRGVDGVVQQQNRVTRGRKQSVLINQYRCVCLSYRLMDEINSLTVFGSVYSEGGWRGKRYATMSSTSHHRHSAHHL